jgi:hypothetical protein
MWQPREIEAVLTRGPFSSIKHAHCCISCSASVTCHFSPAFSCTLFHIRGQWVRQKGGGGHMSGYDRDNTEVSVLACQKKETQGLSVVYVNMYNWAHTKLTQIPTVMVEAYLPVIRNYRAAWVPSLMCDSMFVKKTVPSQQCLFC